MRTRHKITYETFDGSAKIDLSDRDFVYLEPSFFGYTRGYTLTDRVRGGSEITGRHQPAAVHTLQIQLHHRDRAAFYDLDEKMRQAFAYDWHKGQLGRLTVNGWQIDCTVTDLHLRERQTLIDYIAYEATFVCPRPDWYKVQRVEWLERGRTERPKGAKRYTYRYPYRYSGSDQTTLSVTTVRPGTVRIRVFGPAERPSITIGDQLYAFPLSLGEGESATVDGHRRRLFKTLATGETVNFFDARPVDRDIFAELRPGSHTATRSGDFTAEIDLYTYRDTPPQEVRRVWT